MNKLTKGISFGLALMCTSCSHSASNCNLEEARREASKNATLISEVSISLSSDGKEVLIKEKDSTLRFPTEVRPDVWKELVLIHDAGGCIYSMKSLPKDTGQLAGYTGYAAFERGKPPKYLVTSIR